MSTLLIFLVFVSFARFGASDTVIRVNKCHLNDVSCITASSNEVLKRFADGIPEYKVERLDPIFFKTVNVSYPALKVLGKNLTATGVKGCNIRKMEIVDSIMRTNVVCNLTIDGDCEMDGQILMFPIKGNGHLHAYLQNVIFDGEADFTEVTGKDGEEHWKVTGYRYSFNLTERAQIKMDNMFKENELLNKGVQYLMENDPNMIVMALGDSALGVMSKVVFTNVNRFMRAVPRKDLVLD